ncbi:TetR/AcrR family transcriptional regulator [Nocardioides endophyticus]|uniref:TetR/AcrR family transcriptional regulator n=1 Tax=Nocardioides endophyticus TaxID=1353775 RepID=A0ABP8YCW9_9ACTN
MAQRTRDPARKEKILDAAAGLLADSGYHSVSMAEIGERAGIVGSGIYRHFESKAAILVELFEQVIDDLLAQARSAVEGTDDLQQALDQLVQGQIEFVVFKRHLAQIYYSELSNLPRDDQVRLRRKQRLYLEEWVHVLGELEGLSEPVTRTRVYVAIGAIQAVLFHQVVLSGDELVEILTRSAQSILKLA